MAAIGLTLGRYFSRRFAQAIFGVFMTVFLLVYTLDFVELMRRAGDAQNASATLMAKLALYRTPAVAEHVLPFAVLLGAMAAFLMLSRRLELVVARAAGVSVWQFLQPAIFVAGAIGVLTVTVYNPLSARLKREAIEIESRIFMRGSRAAESAIWLRQRSPSGPGIIRAGAAAEGGRVLADVIFFLFDQSGSFRERVEAGSATLGNGRWELVDAHVFSAEAPPKAQATYAIATNLKPDLVRRTVTPPDSVSFWQLKEEADLTEEAGLDATRYRLQYQSLLARPFLFVAMVIIASTVSLRFFRMGGVGRTVLGGVTAGFVLYVGKKLVEDLGTSGIIGTAVAAWAPAIVGCLVGTVILLHLEDG